MRPCFLLVCLALLLHGAWGGTLYTVNENSCTFLDAIADVNLGFPLACLNDSIPTADPFDEINITGVVSEIPLSATVTITESLKITGPPGKVSFVRQSGFTSVLFHFEGALHPGMVAAFEDCIFTQEEPTTQVINHVGPRPTVGHILATDLTDLSLTRCRFDSVIVRTAGDSNPRVLVGFISCHTVETITISDCEMTDSDVVSLSDAFGALFSDRAMDVTIEGTTVTSTVATAGLGSQQAAVAISSSGTVSLNGCAFVDNVGRAVAVQRQGDDPGLTVLVDDCIFRDNLEGGGLQVVNALILTVTCSDVSRECDFTGNRGTSGAGIEAIGQPQMTLIATNLAPATLSNNLAQQNGGAVSSDGPVILSGTWSVIGNGAVGDGGAFFAQVFASGTGASVFEDNFASGDGGVVFASQSIVLSNAARLVNNTAAGGGVACCASGAATVSVLGSVVDNEGNAGGGGVILTLSSATAMLTVLGSTAGITDVRGNTATGPGVGGGVIRSGGDANLIVCTQSCSGANIDGNQASSLGAVVEAIGAVNLEFGNNVNIVNNILLDADGLGGAIYAGGIVSLQGGGVFSSNGVGCSSGGSIYAENDVIMAGDSLQFLGHSVNAGGGAVRSLTSITATLLAVDDNTSNPGNGGAFLAAATITINRIGSIMSNSADLGGAFYADTVSIFEITGTVSNNNVLSADHDSGSVAWGNAATLDTFNVADTGRLENNLAPMAHSEGSLNVRLGETTTITGNAGLFTAQGVIAIEATGARFEANHANSKQRVIHSFTSTASINEPGDIVGNNFELAFLSAPVEAKIESFSGEVAFNTGAAFMRADTVKFKFEGEENSIHDNESVRLFLGHGFVQVTGSGVLDILDNECVLLFTNRENSVIECELGENSKVSGNIAPLAVAEKAGALVNLEVGEITGFVANDAVDFGIVHVNATMTTVNVIAPGGICGNFATDSSDDLGNGFLLSTADGLPLTSATVTVSALGSSIESNIETVAMLPPMTSGSASVTTVLYGASQVPLDPSVTLTVSLQEPLSLMILTPPPTTVNSGDSFTVQLRLDTFVAGVVFVSVTTDSDVHDVLGAPVGATSSVVTFSSIAVSGPTGDILLIFSVDGTCTDISVTVPLDVVAVQSTPAMTVSPSGSVSGIATPTRTASISAPSSTSATPTGVSSTSTTTSAVPSVLSSAGAGTSSKTPASTASPTQPAGSSAIPSFTRSPPSPALSPTPVGPAPPRTVGPIPSLQASPSPTVAVSLSRSSSRTQVPTVAPTCVGNCVATGSDPVDERVLIVDNSGEPVGTVQVPATSVQPGETIIVGPGTPEAEAAARQLNLGSSVVEITFIDANGQSVQPNGDIEVCLHVSDTDKAADDGCLSFFDEDRMEWVCEDPCLEIDGSTVCGTVNHLTNFAVLFTGGGGGSGCGDDDDGEALIFDSAWKDGIFVASFFVGAVFICVLIILVALLFPSLTDRIHGAEYRRIKSLRDSSIRTNVQDFGDESITIIE